MNSLFIFGAKYLIFVPVLALAGYFLYVSRLKKWRMFLLALLSSVFVLILRFVAGLLYYDPRPFVVGNFTPLVAHAADNGFPSDHTLLAAALAMIALYFNRRLGIFLWVIAILIAISRVEVGVHHAVDVVASMLIAIVSVWGAASLLKRNRNTDR